VIRAEKALESKDFAQCCLSAETQKARTARFSEGDYKAMAEIPMNGKEISDQKA